MAREMVWIELAVIEALHERLVAEHSGASGLRDGALLKSAIARPQHLAAYSGLRRPGFM